VFPTIAGVGKNIPPGGFGTNVTGSSVLQYLGARPVNVGGVIVGSFMANGNVVEHLANVSLTVTLYAPDFTPVMEGKETESGGLTPHNTLMPEKGTRFIKVAEPDESPQTVLSTVTTWKVGTLRKVTITVSLPIQPLLPVNE
jgi:hypothetical protein